MNMNMNMNRRFCCRYCSKCFTHKTNSSRHEKECSKNPDKLSKTFSCDKCFASFLRKDNLNAHSKSCKADHPQKQQSNIAGTKRTPCLVKDCKAMFFHKSSLIDHLSEEHRDVVSLKAPVVKTFSSHEEFVSWKEKEEEETFSYFSQKCGKFRNGTTYFYCQHDGSPKHSEKKTSRKNKKGQIKVGHYCIAKMTMSLDDHGKIIVKYFPTHSHICKPEDFIHHPLPVNTAKFINQQLADEVSPSKIFKKVQTTYISSNTDNVINHKANILTKKMIRERARQQNLARNLHTDDAKSVFLKVKIMNEKENSVLIYKPLGTGVIYGSAAINDLPNSEDLFLLGIQTPRQLELLKQYAGKIIVIDETHGTNQYKFQLLTVLVVDNNRRGWPVAHLITSKSDAATLKFFFAEIKSKLNDYCSFNCVITDDDPALINAVNDGFQENVRHILCKWHVLKALRDNLKTKVSKEYSDVMFDEVKVIVNTKDEVTFNTLCSAFFKKYECNDKTSKFLSYFKQYYMERTEKWAMCFRNYPHGEVNTTGHVESFHNKLKKVCLKRKVNKRLDNLLNILVDLEWEDYCTRCREAVTGPSNLPQHISERHQRSLSINDETVSEVCNSMWEIISSQNPDVGYVVELLHVACPADLCFCKCSNATCHGLCSHYCCSCPDNHPLCKHIHKVHALKTRNQPNVTVEPEQFYILPTEHEPFQEMQSANVSTTSTTQDTKYSNMVNRLQSNILILEKFQQAALNKEVPEHVLAHVDALVENVVGRVQNLTREELEKTLPHMKPSVKFNSNEKLKTQISQLLPFKRPLGKRKVKHTQAELAEKKKKVVRDLLQYLPEQDPNCTKQLP